LVHNIGNAQIYTGILLTLSALCVSDFNLADVGAGYKACSLDYGSDFNVPLTKTVDARISFTSFYNDA
jgi:hypothetical protein